MILSFIGTPCDISDLPAPDSHRNSPWDPFESRGHFTLADFLYRRSQMSAGHIDELMEIWGALHPNGNGPFGSHHDLHKVLDSIEDGDAPWESFTMNHPKFTGNPEDDDHLPLWQKADYDVWFRDPRKVLKEQLSNPTFKDGIDYAPKIFFGNKNERIFENFMSGNWAWKQCVSWQIVFTLFMG
jgi:hypothetical protein